MDGKNSLDNRTLIVNRQNQLEYRAIDFGFNGITFRLIISVFGFM
jgi:hypothetical protein